ncbi:DUF503 domain-containing protein [Myxococcaceae bacterium GXIMD 01537]
MFVCVARITLQIPESGSLKAKRQVLRRVTDRVKARFNVSIAEVDDQDLWQRASLALAVVGNDRRHVDEQMSKVLHFIEEMYVAPLVSRETEIIGFGEHLYASTRPGDAAGEAEDWSEDEDGEEGEEGGDLSTEELIANFAKGGQRSMAEAEGMGAWERRHEGQEGPEAGRPGTGRGGKMTLDEARARARSLRNPRDWEKK